MRLTHFFAVLTAAFACTAARAEEETETGAVMFTYETIVETFQGSELVDTYSLRGQREVPSELLEQLGENSYDGDTEFHLYITFTRYSDTFLTACIVLCVFILFGFVVSERVGDDDEDSDDEDEDEDLVQAPQSNDLTEPLCAK